MPSKIHPFFKYIPEKSALCEVELQTKSYYQIAKVNIWFIFPQSCKSLLEKNVMKFRLRFSFLFLFPTFIFWGLAEQAWHYNDTWCWHYNGIWSRKTSSHASKWTDKTYLRDDSQLCVKYLACNDESARIIKALERLRQFDRSILLKGSHSWTHILNAHWI